MNCIHKIPKSKPIPIISVIKNKSNEYYDMNEYRYGLKENCFNPNKESSPPNKWNDRLLKRITEEYKIIRSC